MSFPVIHSTLDPAALAACVAENYGIDTAAKCRLVSRGSNDIYELTSGDTKLAVRVAKADFRTADELHFELDFLDHLASCDVPVVRPVRGERTTPFLSVPAPEGERHITVFQWAPGRSGHPLGPSQATQAGACLARLHDAGHGFSHTVTRAIDPGPRIDRWRQALHGLLGGRDRDRIATEQALDRYEAFVDDEGEKALIRGMTHGDFQPANVLFAEDGTLSIVDFDDCAWDCLVRDLACFIWRNRFDEVGPDIDRECIAGYGSVRPLVSEELDALPMLVMARNLHIFATYARVVDRVGPIPGFQSYDRFVELLEVDRTVEALLSTRQEIRD